MGINTENEVVQQLQAQGVEINTPASASDKEVSISKEKLQQLKIEAENEARGGRGDAKEIYERKVEDLKRQLNEIRADIEHYGKVMEDMGIPHRFASRHTAFHGAKLEYDTYTKLGGTVGQGEFIEKEVSRAESFLGGLDFLRSNIFKTAIIDGINEKGASLSSIYKGEELHPGNRSYTSIELCNERRLKVLDENIK